MQGWRAEASRFGDVHHVAAKTLTNIFVNIFYIDLEDNLGCSPGLSQEARLSLHQDQVTRW
jgi:hypothetical protein